MSAYQESQLDFLVDGCKKANSDCQRKLFQRYFGQMMGICMRYASDEDQAKDFAQEGFIKVFNNIRKYKGKGSFEGWMKRIFINHSLDQIRKNKIDFYSIDEREHVLEYSDDEDEEESLAEHIGQKRLLEEIQQLTPIYRAVFNLYVLEGYSHKEIADELGISIGTSKSNLSKAKARLKKSLSKYLNAKYAS